MQTPTLRRIAFHSRAIRLPLNLARHADVTHDDVFIASYPRSGTTWFRFLMYELLSGRPAEFTSVNAGIPYVGSHRHSPGLLPRGGRVIKTHEAFRHNVNAAIYVVRDPRSVVVSEHRWELRTGLSQQSFPAFVDAFLDGRVNPYDRWDRHVQGWLGSTIASRGHILPVRFEDLTRDTAGELTRILEFLGVEREPAQVAATVENNDLAHMREKEERAPEGAVGVRERPDIRFINAGSTSGWVDQLSREQIERLETRFSGTMAQLGYERKGGRTEGRTVRRHDPFSTDEVKVLYIAGWGRSGSTFLDSLLGQVPGFFSTGEMRYLWDRGVLKGWKCGCGQLVTSCDVWSEVLRQLQLHPGMPPAEAIVKWQREITRIRHTPTLLRSEASGRGDGEVFGAYVDVTRALLEKVSSVTGARVVVDSSKRPSDAALLGQVPNVRLHVVHLVRDPRAVAYSWAKKQPEIDRHGVVGSTLSWLGWNLATEDLRRQLGCPSILVRYEDFVARPQETLRRIVDLVGEDPSTVPPLDGGSLTLARTHTVSGNPARFNAGRVQITPDDRWVEKLSASRKLVATVIASPLMNRYGYSLLPPKKGHERIPRTD